jgi:two-component system, LytTR family, sensor kinase
MSDPVRTILILSNMLLFTCAGALLFYRLDTLFRSRGWPSDRKKFFGLSLLFFCFYMALMPFYPSTRAMYTASDFFVDEYEHILRSVVFVFLPVFIIRQIQRFLETRNVPLAKQQVIIICSIFLCLVSINVTMRLLIGVLLRYSLMWSFVFSLFMSAMISVFYLTIQHSQLAMRRRQFEKELEISRLNELRTRAELEALQAKINPHFLYNTLNSIAELSVSQGLKARKMTMALADLFRYSLNKQNETEITIEQEMEMVENYLLIEKIRFEDKLDVEIEIQKETRPLKIPQFILQPIVENAVKHGIRDPDLRRDIKIIVSGDTRKFKIIVRDNGEPFPENIQMGYGLKNISDKMAWYYPSSHSIFFENSPFKQVVISITNPLNNGRVV